MWHLVNGSMNILEKTKLAAWIRNIKQIFKINNTDLSKPGKSYEKEEDGETAVKKRYEFEKSILSLKIKKLLANATDFFKQE